MRNQSNRLLYMTFVAWEVPIGGEVFVGFISFKPEAFTSFVHGKGHLMDYILQSAMFWLSGQKKNINLCL